MGVSGREWAQGARVAMRAPAAAAHRRRVKRGLDVWCLWRPCGGLKDG